MPKQKVTVNGVIKFIDIAKLPVDENGKPITILLNKRDTKGAYKPDSKVIKKLADEQKQIEAEAAKEEALSRLTVTVNGKVFYADTPSRIDLSEAIRAAEQRSIASTLWKLAEPFEGKRVVSVTLDELKEASYLALSAKAQLIGVASSTQD